MLKKIITLVITLTTLFGDTLETLKNKKELDYSLVVGKKIKTIQFEKNFLRITFEDGTVMCENDTVITDNCKILLNKKEVLNNTHSTHFMFNVLDIEESKPLFLMPKEKSNIYYLIDVNKLEKDDTLKKINEIKSKFNVLLIPTKEENKEVLKKFFSIELKKETLKKVIELYNINQFELPITVVIPENLN